MMEVWVALDLKMKNIEDTLCCQDYIMLFFLISKINSNANRIM